MGANAYHFSKTTRLLRHLLQNSLRLELMPREEVVY